MAGNRQPLGIELVRRGIVGQEDITKALEYQKNNPNERLGDILNKLGVADSNVLLQAIGEILDEKTILLKYEDIQIKIEDYISIDTLKKCLAIPYEISNGTIKVCFASTTNGQQIESIRLLMLNKGLVMQRYITFKENIEAIISRMDNTASKIDTDSDVTTIVDNIIRGGMQNRASDIHIEPLENTVKVRYRIDGRLVDVATVDKDKQSQIIGRLKSLSNMHQEKQEPQDGRITAYPEYNIRSSSQKNIYGEKFVLRLLKKNQTIKTLFELGYPQDSKLLRDAFNKRNSITIIAAPTGVVKTTTLYSTVSYLN